MYHAESVNLAAARDFRDQSCAIFFDIRGIDSRSLQSKKEKEKTERY
jgi:hypothetical protein